MQVMKPIPGGKTMDVKYSLTHADRAAKQRNTFADYKQG